MTTWRDILPIHPAADALPLLPKEALQELADDISKNGLLVSPSIVVGEGNKDYLIDGRNRLDAMELAGYVFTSYVERRLHYDRFGMSSASPLYLELEDLSGTDPVAIVIAENLRRRHLSPGELVRLALAIRATAQPETPPNVAVSVGGRGHKGEASVIAEQTGVPIRTVQR
jgi:hypothetical protein